jgi:beta-lactamase class D
MVEGSVRARSYFVPCVALVLASGCTHRIHSASRFSDAPQVVTAERASCFLLYEMGVGEVRRSPADACATRVSPASTFKIAHALAALDSGVLADAGASLPYDGAPVPFERWRRDHTLATAMRYSVVWYFQRVATMLGERRERAYAERLDYGNRDISSGLTTFWLDGSLRISPEEQERFLVRLYENSLPVRPEAMRAVRDIIVQPQGAVVSAMGEHSFAAPWPAGTILGAKTGRGNDVSWLVGHIARGPHAWVFVSCVVGERLDARASIDLAATSLQAARVL